jgi:lysyl-tRNA synthetase class 2
MLEFYEAYSNYRDLMDLTEELVGRLAKKIHGSSVIRYGEHEIDFGQWQRLSMHEAISKYWPEEAGAAPTVEELKTPGGPRSAVTRHDNWAAHKGHATIASGSGVAKLSNGDLIGLLFEAVAEEKLIRPTILYDFPIEISPLSKQKPDDPSLVERFEVFVAGMEIGNAFSELNDPVEQERRFRQQIEHGGDEVPKQLDVDYIRALTHGMPPAAGMGIGIDRLTMLFTDSHSIRDVILFPLLRPEAVAEERANSVGETK